MATSPSVLQSKLQLRSKRTRFRARCWCRANKGPLQFKKSSAFSQRGIFSMTAAVCGSLFQARENSARHSSTSGGLKGIALNWRKDHPDPHQALAPPQNPSYLAHSRHCLNRPRHVLRRSRLCLDHALHWLNRPRHLLRHPSFAWTKQGIA